MDYQAFLNSYRLVYDEYISYLENSINKNVLKGNEIVKDYLLEISSGNYSLKSYKAKIIRNEQEHHQIDSDIIKKSQEAQEALRKQIEIFFDEYQKIDSTKYQSPNRQKDLRIILSNIRREKMLLNENKVALEKELSALKKEFESNKKNKEKAIREKIKNLKNNYHIQKDELYNVMLSSLSEQERLLLDCDDKIEISKIKTIISQKRKDYLDKELILKQNTCEEIDKEYLMYIEESEKALFDYNTVTSNKKIAHYDLVHKLNMLDISMSEKGKIYDIEQQRKNMQDYNESFTKLIEDIKKQNEYLRKGEYADYKLFPFELLLLNFSYFLTMVQENDEYEELSLFVKEIISEIKTSKDKFIELNNKIPISLEKKKQDLVLALNPYKDLQTEEYDDFINNVTSSLDRFYNNLQIQVDKFYLTYFEMMMEVSLVIVDIYNEKCHKLISKMPIEGVNVYTDYHYTDLKKYGYSDIVANISAEYYDKLGVALEKKVEAEKEILKAKKKDLDIHIDINNKEISQIKNNQIKKYNKESKELKQISKTFEPKYLKTLDERKMANKKSTDFKRNSALKSYRIFTNNL